MSFIEIVRPRRDGRDVRAAIQRVAGGLRLAISVPEMLVSVAGLRRTRGQTLLLLTQRVPWEGGIRDREGRQMRLAPTRRRSTRCRHITDDPRAPLIVLLPEDWFEAIEGAAVFCASEWRRRRAGG